jgi:glutamine synthetase type III
MGFDMNKLLQEEIIANIITEELKKSDVVDIIKKDKDVEKRVKDIVREIVKDMYRILYQHNGIFTALGK